MDLVVADEDEEVEWPVEGEGTVEEAVMTEAAVEEAVVAASPPRKRSRAPVTPPARVGQAPVRAEDTLFWTLKGGRGIKTGLSNHVIEVFKRQPKTSHEHGFGIGDKLILVKYKWTDDVERLFQVTGVLSGPPSGSPDAPVDIGRQWLSVQETFDDAPPGEEYQLWAVQMLRTDMGDEDERVVEKRNLRLAHDCIGLQGCTRWMVFWATHAGPYASDPLYNTSNAAVVSYVVE
jgi:hypothetical protein